MCTRGRAFCGERRRAPRVGCRRHVDESRAAGKPRQALFATDDEEERRRESSSLWEREGGWRLKEKERNIARRGHSRAFGYLYIFRFQPTRVAACLVAVPGSTFLRHTSLVLLAFPINCISSLCLVPLHFRSAYHRSDGPQTNA